MRSRLPTSKPIPRLPDRDRFGGWRDGPKQQATGFFRTVKQNGKWWLVDPDGALFISLGVDVVTPNESTIITGRESMFTGLPMPGDPLARHFGTVRGIHSGPVKEGRTFNFYAANLERTYGPEFLPRWRETTLNRLKSWGFNTIGNWSDPRVERNGQVPYVATVSVSGNHARVGSGSDYWGKMHDPFDPKFAESVQSSLQWVVSRVKRDPWCLGYFVDNELSWGSFGDEGGRYGLGLGALSLPAASSPAKRAIVDQLKKKYVDISKLNEAWKTSLSGWQALEAPWQPAAGQAAWTTAFKADLAAFVKELARTYFKTVRDRLKAADPDHLYLGCRFAWRTEEAVAAAAEFCDVVSFNIYDRQVDPGEMGVLPGPGAARDHRRVSRRGSRSRYVPPRPGRRRRPERACSDLHQLCRERAQEPGAGGLPLVSVRGRAVNRTSLRRRELQHRVRVRHRHVLSRARHGRPRHPPPGLPSSIGQQVIEFLQASGRGRGGSLPLRSACANVATREDGVTKQQCAACRP